MLVLSFVIGPPDGALLGFVVARQVGTDYFPALSFVRRFEEHVRARVQRIWIMRRKDDREVPLEAILQIARAPTHRIVRVGIHVAQLAGVMIVTRNQTVI